MVIQKIQQMLNKSLRIRDNSFAQMVSSLNEKHKGRQS